MKKYVSAALVGLAFLAPVSAALAQTADALLIKNFSITVAEPTTWPVFGIKPGTPEVVRWDYPNGANPAQVHTIDISLIGPDGAAHSAATFSGVYELLGTGGSNVTLVKSRTIKIPKVDAGDYYIRVSATSNAQTGSVVVPGITSMYRYIEAATSTPTAPNNPPARRDPKITARISFSPATKVHLGDTVSLKITSNAKSAFSEVYLLNAANGEQVATIAEGQGTGDISWTVPTNLPTTNKYYLYLHIIKADYINGLAHPSDPLLPGNMLATYTSPAFSIFPPATTGSTGGNGGNGGYTSNGPNHIAITSCNPTVTDAITGADLTASPGINKVPLGASVVWTAVTNPALDASADYAFAWSGSEGLSGSSLSSLASHHSFAGLKTARITISLGGKIVGSRVCRSVRVAAPRRGGAAVFDAVSSFWDSLWHN